MLLPVLWLVQLLRFDLLGLLTQTAGAADEVSHVSTELVRGAEWDEAWVMHARGLFTA